MVDILFPHGRHSVLYALTTCLLLYVLLFVFGLPGSRNSRGSSLYPQRQDGDRHHPSFAQSWDPSLFFGPAEDVRDQFLSRVHRSLSLTEEQCRAVFPGLVQPIDEQVARGPFNIYPSSDLGPMQARIRHGQLVVLHVEREGVLPGELLDARAAALAQIHRALITAPSDDSDEPPMPDTVFSLNIQDHPFGSAWTYALPAYAAPSAGNPPIGRAFLMPHFAFWAWRPQFIGSLARAAAAVARIEARMPFAHKDPRVVWRGTTRFQSAHHPALRQQLLAATAGQPWADVAALDWDDTREPMEAAGNALAIEDFCRYKYVVHTEGITYSGRFQFHQLCGSVVLAPPLAWMQHTSHLVRGVYSIDLLGPQNDHNNNNNSSWVPSEDEERAWPRTVTANEANMVFVAPDWSDLGDTVRWLEAHPAVAEGIARRQRSLFADGGYLSPAAETCYWRSLIRGWSQVVRYNETAWTEKWGDGMTWEEFSLSPRDGSHDEEREGGLL